MLLFALRLVRNIGKDAAMKPLLPGLFDPIRLDELADACVGLLVSSMLDDLVAAL